jgi:hypothetical protein
MNAAWRGDAPCLNSRYTRNAAPASVESPAFTRLDVPK